MKFVYLKIPTENWDTLRETLECDSQSKAFDRALREQISEALASVEEIPEPTQP